MKTTPERNSRLATEHACFVACEAKGLMYHGYRVEVDEQNRLALFAYGSDKKDPTKAQIIKITDVATVRNANTGGNRPDPLSTEAIEKRREAAQKSIKKASRKAS